MKLIDFKYDSRLWDWHLSRLSLNNINLLVGKNATGKSRVIAQIQTLATVIKANNLDEDGKWHSKFINDKGETIEYHLNTNASLRNLDVEEKIWVNDRLVLDRNQKSTSVFSYTLEKMVTIHPPKSTLVLHARRDEVEFPFFEELLKWARSLRYYSFSTLNLKFTGANERTPANTFMQLGKLESENVIKGLVQLGFPIDEIYLGYDFSSKDPNLKIVEQGIKDHLVENELSQGFYRALTLLIHIESDIELSKDYKEYAVSTIMIDDLGEGLDYERATKLGKLLVEKLENSNIQFIATSNDSFLMDVIPIKYWNILRRDGNTVSSLNYQNSKERFDKFLMTGLSNFDLFSSNYLMRPKP